MSSPDKPKTSEGEKLQVELASRMFDEGSKVKEATRDSFMASNRRDNRSQLMARVGAESAKVSKERLQQSRRQGSYKTVDGGVDVKSAGIAATGKGGRSYDAEGDIVRRDTSSTERVARSMGAEGHQRSMSDFVEDNKKKQAVFDLIGAGAQVYMYGTDSEKSGKSDKGKTSGNDANASVADILGALE
ncbi:MULTISPECIES: hypothetical protein [Pseudoalteromonas]|uniref:hypothetical protein n=1 Tax=Pseudoalteromonas TaxID=53246 RepID=UPI0006DC29F2|nr:MULTISPECIES: hypothetical protein [Pseudoalteromonas]KPW03240.1 hypothetical protein AN390_01315 [Pseudoalteromonas sp. P1-11]MAA72706.1 hypothetical protein [Bermanella sp.]MBN38233.1 hypothetical protein [Opitutae bacterium]MDI3243821.1 hypothetical protein [Pseudoalteromonas agarivorans]|tara:strand:- start:1669 stop:2232 length:564 start_codon:yes stop_codon:yes gene_type:complete